MFILLAVTFTLGVFLGVLIVCLLIIAKESSEAKMLSRSDGELTSAPNF